MSTDKKPQRRGLGRGFDALLPLNFDNTLLLSETDKIQKIDVNDIAANSDQPRRHFDQNTLTQLAESIKRYGVIQPLIVTPIAKNKYMIIAGERRWRAAKAANLEVVPVIVRSSKELEQLEIALVENVQRVDLSPLEQATSITRLHHQFNLTYEVIAARLGKAVSTIHNTARLLQLPENAQKALREQIITEGHARALLALKGFEVEQNTLLLNIKQKGWSVRQAERFVTAFKEGIHDTKKIKGRVKSETTETKKLSRVLGTPVNIRRTARGGKLEISFTSDEELTRVIKRFLQIN